MSGSKEGFIKSQGVKIHYLAKNLEADKISLLFVPGFLMPAWIWDKQLDFFSKEYRVAAIDIRSQGDSEQATEGHYAYSIAKDIKAMVDELKLEPFILVGWSLAVPEVVNYALHFGGKGLRGLVLVDGLAGIDPSLPFYQSTIDYWMALQTDRKVKTKEFIKSIFKKPQKESYLEKLLESALRTPTNTAMTFMDNYLLQDFRKDLSRLVTPTLITTVNGPRLDYMKRLQTLIPRAHLEIIDDAGHALFVDQPEAFNRLLETFIEGLQK
ncbi:alpha/beta fold hydrolase [Criblamydia sequanensis]|uniref:Alpha/beta hydrolase n=1 Tax=Candidatus Criblamydia sequanensis CRIB-18 TaxID=1437425 RepID=A0A090D119_9BACT|nr:alpha/beta hydrolase [Criblamydia sequanensis]CDR35252.1 Alpha/beta hydrolase [Criblamydia sequanensis CRIB-18]